MKAKVLTIEAKKVMITNEALIHNREKKSVFLWCLHCERTYRRGECRVIDRLQMCPYSGCDGDTVMDGWPWGSLREGHPDYPVIPIEGIRYPMYGEQKA